MSIELRTCCVLSLALLTLTIGGSAAVAEDCDPARFIAQDIEHYVITDEMRIAFLQTAKQEQYEEADKHGATAFNYGVIGGNLSYGEAHTAAQKDADSSQFSYERDVYLNYMTERMSPESSKMYSACLEMDKSTPGLRIWLSKRQGDFFTLRAFWVGGTEGQGEGRVVGEPKVKNVEIIELPTVWPRGTPQSIVISKTSNNDAYFSLNVDGKQQTYIILHDPPPALPVASHVISGQKIEVENEHSEGTCKGVKKQGCVTPQTPGGFLVPGSGVLTDFSMARPDEYKQTVEVNRPEQICISLLVTTSDCPKTNRGEGVVSAIERYRIKQ